MKLVITVKVVDEDGTALAAHESIINDFDEQPTTTTRDVVTEFVRQASFNMRLLIRKGGHG